MIQQGIWMEEICFRLFISPVNINNNIDDGCENSQIPKQIPKEKEETHCALWSLIISDTSPHVNPCEKSIPKQHKKKTWYKRKNKWIVFEGSMGVEGRGKPEQKPLRKVASFKKAGLVI